MPAKGFQKKAPIDVRIKVGFSANQAALLADRAKAAGVTQAAYLRGLFLFEIGEVTKKPTPKRQHDSMLLAGEAHLLAMQLKKLGVNFNQMAKQVNTGLVPLQRHEVDAMNRLFAVAMEKATAVFERILAR